MVFKIVFFIGLMLLFEGFLRWWFDGEEELDLGLGIFFGFRDVGSFLFYDFLLGILFLIVCLYFIFIFVVVMVLGEVLEYFVYVGCFE